MSTRTPIIFRIELLLIAWASAAIVLYHSLDVPLRSPKELYIERVSQSLALYFVGLFISLLVSRLKAIRVTREPWRVTVLQFRRNYLSLRPLLHDLRLMNAISLVFVLFIEFKNLIPRVNGSLWDGWFIATETAVFGGKLAAFWVQSLFGTHSAGALSDIYLLFYPFMAIVLLLAVLQRDRIFAQRFVLAFGLVWLIGILVVYLVPTLGPCFAVPGVNDSLPLTEVSNMQLDLWKHKIFLEQHPESEKGVFLISGFPSLHLAVPILCTLMFYRKMKWLSAAALIFSILTTIATLYFAWHYLLDDIGAVFLAVFAFMAASKIVPDLDQNGRISVP